ncbi:MAG: iron-containing alcohol dehydrogenase [Treponema sp.]|jgi:alcohol dehydrogenase class IV|nr:iron-containing alcohol dehydrogenase [Treponema sp.]
MEALCINAKELLSTWKRDRYVFGRGVLGELGSLAAKFSKSALVVCSATYTVPVSAVLEKAGVSLAGDHVVRGASPNTPREDVYRIATYILQYQPDVIIAVGGGSTIDACKAANFLATLGKDVTPELDHYFGTGVVSVELQKTGKKLYPLIAVQTSASSGTHLTKYANVTDPVRGQKKLVVDEALTPQYALFDYDLTGSMPRSVTIDGVLDVIAHCTEVFSGISSEQYDLVAEITETAMELTIQYAPKVIANPSDMEAREALGMATDLGGYAIMLGSTNGAHLTSFSLVDLTGHGSACGIMNPYYMVFFAPKIERQVRLLGSVFKKHGYIIEENPDALFGKDLGLAVAKALIAFSTSIGAPTTLKDLPGFNDTYIDKALEAAKDPQLEMKLKNMPVPFSSALVDEYMGPILRAAASGDFSLIKTVFPSVSIEH